MLKQGQNKPAIKMSRKRDSVMGHFETKLGGLRDGQCTNTLTVI